MAKTVRKRKVSENDDTSSKLRSHYNSIKEDLENKLTRRKNCCTRSANKKKVLEEANNSKLRDVQVRVENCLQNALLPAALSALCRRSFEESVVESTEEHCSGTTTTVEETKSRADCEQDSVLDDTSNSSSVQLVQVEVHSADEEQQVRVQVPVSEAVVSGVHSEEDDCVIVAQKTTVKTDERECSSRGDDDGPLSSSSPFSRMELSDATNTSLLRFPDDRSDSGVSSLRSGSGDERSGSRSSALSSSDEPQHSSTQNQPTNRSPLFISATPTSFTSATPASNVSSEPVRVWRDPSLLLESEPHVRHINSVQHQSLLMSHPSAPASAGPPPTSASHPAALYPSVPPHPPAIMSPHPLPHHPHLQPPGLYHPLPEMIWKQRYQLPVNPAHILTSQGAHNPAEEMLERERVFAQDRDRHERLLR